MRAKREVRKSIAICTSLRLKPCDRFGGDIMDIDPNMLKSFSNFLDANHGQLRCYSDTCSQTVNEFLNGRNCTLFVYGQTGSGKTHTLFGPPNSFHGGSLTGTNARELFQGVYIPHEWGAFPRTVLQLLDANKKNMNRSTHMNHNKGPSSISIIATAVEIYMDNCYDLMRDKQKIAVAGFGRSAKTTGRGSFLETTEVKRDSSGRWIPPRTLVERPKKNEGYEMRGAKSKILSDVNSLLDFMRVVEATRTSKSHKLNERSSRSHCVITLTMPSVTNAKYMLVDLAGSERIMKSGSIQSDLKAAEAKNINTSLTSLGRCITALARGNNAFVPYRDSVLTMLLKQSLGGNCYTSVVVTATADIDMQSETIASIKFGMRCAKVMNEKVIECRRTSNNEMVMSLLEELKMIDDDLKTIVDTGGSGGLNEEFPTSLQQSFMSNMKKYKSHKQALDICKQQIKSGRIDIEKTKNYEESQVRNLQGILLRSMTTGVWTDPSPRYIKYVQRRTDIVSTLKGLGHSDSISTIEIPLTLEHLMRDFKG